MTTKQLTAADLRIAAEILNSGGLVVFPTETVYGLGADASSEAACRAVFHAKGRPPDNPLIVHVEDIDAASRVASVIPDGARRLMEAFWPGPLTVVLPKARTVAAAATAGLKTVAVRCPDHDVARGLIEASGGAVAAPSANRSGRPSPTDFDMAVRNMDGRVEAIIDGGPCRRGIESTVVTLSADTVVILRPGSISREMIDSVVPVRSDRPPPEQESASPGTRHAHYQPDAELFLAPTVDAAKVADAFPRRRVGVICLGCPVESSRELRVRSMNGVAEYARRLYRTLVDLDDEGCEVIVAEVPPRGGIGDALIDRLRRAAGGRTLED